MAQQAQNKVQFGLKNAHYAVATDDGEKLTYGVPIALRGSVEISMDPEGETNPFYADDTNFYNSTSNQGYSGKLTVALVTDDFREQVLGEQYDDNGLLVEGNDSHQHPFALMFEFDGDQSATRHVLYNVTATRPAISGKTKEDKTEPDTQELNFSASPNPYTNKTKAKTTVKTSKEVFDSFYTKVQEPAFVTGGTTPPVTTPETGK